MTSYPLNCPCCSLRLESREQAIQHFKVIKNQYDKVLELILNDYDSGSHDNDSGSHENACSVCTYTATKPYLVERHFWSHFKGRRCCDCGKEFTSGSLYISHKCKDNKPDAKLKFKRKEQVRELGLKPENMLKSSCPEVVVAAGVEQQVSVRVERDSAAHENYAMQSIWQEMMTQSEKDSEWQYNNLNET
ncbi:hypothetical protein Forpe1208_v017134 [Fusarium oxysporum f. sp. rapae]|uniref:C2H2-type domain-containing protein n=1 Tax=Fusarium oxysporum f. sp. rapae TaxID=485398 RepID=A0A8J5NFB2_FUSOX|nr:hypothetical protein Forpe1208_v017134 [Fusarium oxysporum f. sp. rapae]